MQTKKEYLQWQLNNAEDEYDRQIIQNIIDDENALEVLKKYVEIDKFHISGDLFGHAIRVKEQYVSNRNGSLFTKKEYDVVDKSFSQVDTKERVCPICNRTYTEHPAISRKDNKTEICPKCGIDEAMEDYLFGVLKDYTKKK